MRPLLRLLLVSAVFLLVTTATLLAQGTGSIAGRVVDQNDLVLPGATLVVTNTQTGATRETVSNESGLFTVSALTPGTYEVKSELTGFSPASAQVQLFTASTVTVNLKLGIASLKETLTVSAAAPLVEVSQSVVASTIRQQEVRELPMINRSLAGMMLLLPGAREVEASGSHGHASNYVSFAGNTGRSYNMYVDGIDNKEDQDGGTLIQYSLDGVEEFRALGAGFQAEFGRGSTVVTLATKSGTNRFKGTGYVFGRNGSMVATDYFSKTENGGLGEQPFNRLQFGGSIGGPIAQDRAWFFSSVERIRQDFRLPRAGGIVSELQYLPQIIPGVKVEPFLPQPFRDTLFQARTDFRIAKNHNGFVKFASQDGYVDNATWNGPQHVNWQSGYLSRNDQSMYAAVGGWTWIPSNSAINEFRMQYMSYLHRDINGNPCTGSWNDCILTRLAFRSVASDRPFFAHPDWVNYETKLEFVNNFSKQIGRHSIKVGVDYASLPTFYADLNVFTPGQIQFFDDPSVILTNSNNLYPQGIRTPGAVQSITVSSQYQVRGESSNAWFFAGYAQDDFKVNNRLTLNLGLRYDVHELINNCCFDRNRTGQVLRAIGHPYGPNPKTDRNNWAPRLGAAYDIKGDGSNVLRGSFGVFYATGIITSAYQQNQLSQDVIIVRNTLANTAVGQGALANYVFGVSPLPTVPAAPTDLPFGGNTTGYFFTPDFADAYSMNSSAGFSHLFGPRTVLSVDYLNVLVRNGWRSLDINPLVDHDNNAATPAIRALAPDLQRAFGDPGRLGPAFALCSCNKGSYDGVDVHFEHRFTAGSAFQMNYTLSWARGMGGASDFTTQGFHVGPQSVRDTLGTSVYDPWETGPTALDERHRVVLAGVLPLPFGFNVAPVVTMATARPYTQYGGLDQFGYLQYVKDEDGQPAGPNNARGKALFNANARVTRVFELPRANKVSVFAEFYNLTNRANFGNSFGGFAFAPGTYNQPTGYLGGIGSTTSLPISFQMQVGARYEF